jgi:hypothetical protein
MFNFRFPIVILIESADFAEATRTIFLFILSLKNFFFMQVFYSLQIWAPLHVSCSFSYVYHLKGIRGISLLRFYPTISNVTTE